MLRSPVLGLPLELDIGLLRQHYTLLRKRSSVVAVARRQIRDGVDIGGSALHGERYTRFFWNVLVFYDGSTGFAETLREELAQVLKSTDVTVDIDFQGTTFFALWIEGLT